MKNEKDVDVDRRFGDEVSTPVRCFKDGSFGRFKIRGGLYEFKKDVFIVGEKVP